MKGILFTGGHGPEKRFIESFLAEADRVIAADSGADLAASFGIMPDIIVGDMDSLSDKTVLRSSPKEKVMIFNSDKDETDTEIALRLLHENGCSEITIVGGGGGRLDHLIAILYLFEREIYPLRWITHDEVVVCIDATLELEVKKGERVSFFPIGKDKCTMKTRGLKWPLDGLQWQRGDFGISNICTEERLSVTMQSGRIILIRALY
ncbi:MAG: thiamine diphosphokinase [Spirochaetota bacterium]